MADLTLIDEDRVLAVPCTIAGDTVRLTAATVHESLGWELRDEGLCRGDQCVLVPDRGALVSDAGLDLAALASALRRPLALDAAEGVAVLGTPLDERAGKLATLEAPDFELPDLEGKLHSLSRHRGKKVLLIAYASW